LVEGCFYQRAKALASRYWAIAILALRSINTYTSMGSVRSGIEAH